MANGFIGQININDNIHLIGSTLFGTCDNLASEAIKYVTLQSNAAYNSQVTGITIHVKFTYANTETSQGQLKLAVRTNTEGTATYTTPKPIVNPNGALTWNAGAIISFTDDGDSWVINSSQVAGSSLSGVSFGNIQSNGILSNEPATIANNDRIVITDNTDNGGRVAKSAIVFDGSTVSTALTPKGTWESFVKSVTLVGGSGITVSDSGTAITESGSRTISIGQNAIANSMLAHSNITIGSVTKNLGETFTLNELGIVSPMNFVGITTSTMTDGETTAIVQINGSDYTPRNGDVVLYGGKEYVWTGTAWEQLGDESSWALANEVIRKDVLQSAGDLIVRDATGPTRLQIDSHAGYVLTVGQNGMPEWAANKATDANVTQNILSTETSNYPLLLSNYLKDATTTTAAAVNRVQSIYVQPSTGTLYATKFHGDGSELENVSVAWSRVTSVPTAATDTLGVVKTTSTVSSTTGLTAAPIISGVVYYKDTNDKVIQAIDSSSNSFPLLFSDNQTSVTTTSITSSAKRNNSIYVKPSAGEIHATKFVGALDTATALGTDSTIATLTFYHKSGDWKTLHINNTTTTIASVSNGILTLTSSVNESATLAMN